MAYTPTQLDALRFLVERGGSTWRHHSAIHHRTSNALVRLGLAEDHTLTWTTGRPRQHHSKEMLRITAAGRRAVDN